jgi:hypothetical protein
MQIQYRGTVTKQDFLKCITMLNTSLKWQRWFFGTVLGLIAFSLIYLWLEGSTEIIQTILDLGPIGLIPIGFLLFPWWMPYLQSTSYNQKTNIYRSEVFGTIDDREITISNGEVRAGFQWSAFTTYKMGKDLLLLRQGKYGFNAFKPNMFSNDHDWEEFVAMTKSKIPSK